VPDEKPLKDDDMEMPGSDENEDEDEDKPLIEVPEVSKFTQLKTPKTRGKAITFFLDERITQNTRGR
jgi:hypothetical protein